MSTTPVKVSVKIEGNIDDVKGLQGQDLIEALEALRTVALDCVREPGTQSTTCGRFSMHVATMNLEKPNPTILADGLVVVEIISTMALMVVMKS